MFTRWDDGDLLTFLTFLATCLQDGMMEIYFLLQGKHYSQTRLQFATPLFFCVATLFSTCSAAIMCPGNQTAELGGQGYIICNFPDDFSSVYWFADTSDRSPVIRLKTDSGVRSGPGFDSGDYDIHQNGSLVILNVTAWHEREYRAIVYTGIAFETFLVSLKVIAAPGINCVPVVNCHNCYQEYYYPLIDTDTLTCSYSVARPAVQLAWFEQMSDGYDYKEMQQLNFTGNRNGTYNSLAILNLFKDSSNFIRLLICRSTWSQSDWRREKEILVDLSRDESFSNYPPNTQYIEVSRYSKIYCGLPGSIYVVWKRILPRSGPELIGFHSHEMTKTVSDIPDVEVSAEGSLIFTSPQVHHEEGIYVCISGDGQKEEIQVTSVQLLIPPSPPYIQITGCDDASYHCAIREDSTKELTCAVYGARPVVALKWIAEDEDEISFFNSKVVFKDRGETFDITLSTEYSVSQGVLCGEKLLIKCHLNGSLSNIMKAESTALVFPASCRENEVKGEQGVDGVVIAVTVSCGILVIVIVISGIMYCRLRNWTKSTTSAAYNDVPVRDSQEASLDNETREPVGEVPDGIPLRNVNAASLDNETREPAGQVPHGIARHNVNDTNEDVV